MSGNKGCWLRRGFPPPLGLLLGILGPFAASGPVRAITGWPLGVSLAAALLLTLPLAVGCWRGTCRASWRRSLPWCLAMAATSGVVLVCLCSRSFHGLVVLASSGIPDAGNHVAHQRYFVERAPNDYAGFVSLYAFVEWLKRIARLDDFFAFAVATHAAILIYACAGLAAAATIGEPADRLRRRVICIGAALGWAIATLWVALPLLHYHQAQGFFPPLFALIPLLGLWFADGLCRPRGLRLGALVLFVVLYRYSYGLNLAGLLLALALVLLLEARGPSARLTRVFCLGGTLVLIGAAAFSAHRLRAIFFIAGPFLPYDVKLVLAGQALMVLTLLLACSWRPMTSILRGSGLGRWVRLPALFAGINAGFMLWVKQPPRGTDYYYLKTNLHPLLLLLAASVVAVAALAAGLLELRSKGATRLQLAGAAALLSALVGSLLLMSRGFAVYWPSFRERAIGRPPYRLLKPLADLDAAYRIRRILTARGARFGGYLTSYYPTFIFMNTSFGFRNGGISFYWGAPPALRPGYCVFWEGGSAQSRLEASSPQQGRCDELSRDPRKVCVGYHPAWDPGAIRTLCWICP